MEQIGTVLVSGRDVAVWRIPVRPVHYLGKCGACKRTLSAFAASEIRIGARQYAEGDKAAHPMSNGCVYVQCCGRDRELRRVQGVYSAKHQCGARCMASKGPSCECSCGGKNHGASYA